MINEFCEKCKHTIVKTMCWETDCMCKCVELPDEFCKKCDHLLVHGICDQAACPCSCEKR